MPREGAALGTFGAPIFLRHCPRLQQQVPASFPASRLTPCLRRPDVCNLLATAAPHPPPPARCPRPPPRVCSRFPATWSEPARPGTRRLPTVARRGMRPLGWGRHWSSGDRGPGSRVGGRQRNFVEVRTALDSRPSGSGPFPPLPPPKLRKPKLALATARAGSGLPVAGAGIPGLPLSARRKL